MGKSVVKVKGGTLEKQIEERLRQITATKIGFQLVLPAEAEFLFWQEFGTATYRIDARGNRVGNQSDAYDIYPVHAKYLVWDLYGQHGVKFKAKFVQDHPGIPPARWYRSQKRTLRYIFQNGVRTAMKRYKRMDKVVAFLRDFVAPEIKDRLRQSIAERVPGHHDYGRLRGATAAEIFERDAQIELIRY